MVFKAIILLTCLVSAHAAIKCRTGVGASAGKHDAKATINYSDCDEGVTQCKLSGVKGLGVAAFKYGCGKKNKVEPDGCKTGMIKVKCYCTGTQCKVPNPTEKKTIQCRSGAGVSAGKHDANTSIKYKDCKEGVTQCKLSGKKGFGVAAYKYGCGEKNKVEPEGCNTGIISVKCYCNGSKCQVPNPTDKSG